MNKLLKISIITSIIGVIALYFLTTATINKIDIRDLENHMGESVRVRGAINRLYVSDTGHVFLKISDLTGIISVVIFRNNNIPEAYSLEVGQEIEVKGMVKEYKGELEIIAQNIKA